MKPSEKFKREVRKVLDDALEESAFNVLLAAAKHLRAYDRDKQILEGASFFAIEKLSEHGYLYEPIKDEDVIIIVHRKTKTKVI